MNYVTIPKYDEQDINLNILECKSSWSFGALSKLFNINLNILECK